MTDKTKNDKKYKLNIKEKREKKKKNAHTKKSDEKTSTKREGERT